MSSYADSRPRSLDRRRAETQHVADKLYHQNGYSKSFDQLSLNRDPFYTHPKAHFDAPRSDVPVEKRIKDPKNVGDVWGRFSDTTSLQGIPFISAAKRWYAKLFWVIILICATVMWVIHSVVLINSYIQFETNSQVTITTQELDFPTITICNINPIRENTVERFGSDQLDEFIELLTPRISEDNNRRARRQSADSEEDDEVDRDHDLSFFNTIDWETYADVGVFDDYLEQDYSSSYLAKFLLRELVATLPDANRTQMGHRIKDMMLGCSYDGFTCSAQNFSRFLDISYGNCFSFNSRELYENSIKSANSGSLYGLDLIIYTQNRDYIKGIQQGRGLRLDVHEFGTQPFVESNGISIPTGFQTYVGLRQVKQTRLGGRYSECGDNGDYTNYYDNYIYNFQACTATCTDRTISAQCKCYRSSRKQFYSESDLTSMRACARPNVACYERVEEEVRNGNTDCGCRQSCKSTGYEYVMSYDQWPDDSLWQSLTGAVCVSVSLGECQNLLSTEEENRETILGRNFVHLKIYYRDLNIENIIEVPGYEDIQFYSDFGGAIGLWLGASIITLFELLDLSCRWFQFSVKHNTYQKRRMQKEKYIEEQSKGSLPSMRGSPTQIRHTYGEDGRRINQLPRSKLAL